MIEDRNVDTEDLEPDGEWKAGEEFDLVSIGLRAVGGECIGDKVFYQECADRNDAAQRMQAAPKK